MKLSVSADCEAMLNELFNQSIAIIAIYQIEAERSTHSGCDGWQVSALSPACAAVYGYSADELIADQALWRSRLHSADWRANQTAIDRSLQANSSPVTRDYRVHHADGSWRWLRESLTFRQNVMEGWTATGIAIEITDRQQIEQQQTEAIAELEAQLAAERERYQVATAALERLNDELEANVIDRTRQLQQSEAKLQDVLNGAITTSIFSCRLFTDGTWVHDVLSAGCEAVFGYTPDELFADPGLWDARVDPQDWAAIVFPAIEAMMTEQSQTIEYRYRHKDNSIRWISAVYTARQDWENYRIVVGVSTDITDRKRLEGDRQQAQLELQAQKDFLQRVIDFVPGCVFVKDTRGVLQIANLATAELYGTTIEDVVGKRITEFTSHLSSAQREQFEAEDRQVMQTRQPLVKQDRIPTVQGQDRWYQVTLRPFVNPQGQMQGVIGNSLDITDRKQTELLLEQQQQTLRAIIDNAPLWIWMCDRDRKVHLANKILAQDVGVTEADFLAAEDYVDIMGAAAQPCLESDALCWATDAPVRSIETHVLSDGRAHTLQVVKTQLKDADGTAKYLVGIALDVTDRIAAEAALRHSEETLRLVVQNMPVMLDAYDANSNLIVWNRECERVTGFRAEEITHNPNSLELLYPDPDYRTEMLQQWTEHAGDFRDWEWDIVCKDGTRKTILWSNVSQEFPIPGWAGWAIGIDSTDRKLAERSLRQSEERYRTLVDNLPGAVYRCANDSSWTASYLSDRIFELTGYSPSDLMSPGTLNFGSIIHPDDAKSLWNDTQAAIEREGCYQNQYRIIHANGQIRWVAEYGRGCYAPDGQLLWLDGVLFDITDRKLIETALQDSEARYRRIVETAGEGIWMIDANSNTTFVNERMAQMLGVTVEQMLGKSMYDFIDAESEPIARSNVDRRRQGIAEQHDFKFKRSDGSDLWTILETTPIFDAAGIYEGALGMLTDITARKRAENQLRDLSDHLSLALKSGAIGVWEWDIAAGTLIWDDRTCELYGLDRTSFTGVLQDWRQRIYPDDLPEATANVQKALQGEQDYDTEFRVVWPDGSIRFIKASAIVQRTKTGAPQRMIGINIDVSVQRQAEAKLRQANEMLAIANLELARANRLKDEFLANMSHELRTPLSAMLGLSRVLQEETFGSLNDRQRQFVETISSSGDHLLALINDILDLAKIGSGRFELESAAVPIHSLCQTSLTFVQPLAKQKNIAIDEHLPPSSCVAILDERRICQVLINLLSNAVKFTPSGGRVTLNVEIDSQSSLRFSVIDTGIGIAPADQALLFQPFVQIDSSLSRHHDGTGLGLALVKQIVELHEGSVSVESQLGKGSCFSVTLPYRSLH